jgi:hypothetical protein
MLRYCISTLDNFSKKNISIKNERKSNNGTKALKHIELLTDKEFEAVRYDPAFQFISDEKGEIEKVMETKEWKVEDKI